MKVNIQITELDTSALTIDMLYKLMSKSKEFRYKPIKENEKE